MQRMRSNWPTNDADLVRTRSAEYLEEYRRVGAKRFEEAVTGSLRYHATGFHPSLGEFLKYVPDAVDKSLDEKLAEWKQQYEAVKDDPEYQRELGTAESEAKTIRHRSWPVGEKIA
jgi:hypothetical protein